MLEVLKTLHPKGYSIKLTDTPASGDVVVLREEGLKLVSNELLGEDFKYSFNLNIYTRYSVDTYSYNKLKSDIIEYYRSIKREINNKTLGDVTILDVGELELYHLGKTKRGENEFSTNIRIGYCVANK